ncbi:hypothetical protein M9H77_13033 [Catharanthus roseus]|uniref:Uncharacterized protein n=1 Tax=Catharanthus roseus TaxID=4058 RepID=A0ACC0BJA3_CATRO|nr:hypothetical protein M9H77_13033 [Catharanthus roseus]
MATSENWQLFVHNGRHNHKIAVYSHSHAQSTRLIEEQLQQTKQFRKSHVLPCNILQFFQEQDVGCAVSSQKIYNAVAKIKRNRMQGRNTVEEVLRLSAEMGYTVFYRYGEDSNVLSDIVVAHPTSIAMIRMWPYVLIMDTTYKTTKEDVVIFWRKLEIGSDIPEEHHTDIESEMLDLTSLLQEISTGPISNVREVRRLIKDVIHPVSPDDPCRPLSTPPETAVTKGRRKTNSTKRDKSHWEYVSIAHRKIGKSSGSGSGSCSSSSSGSNPSPRGRARPPRSGRSRGRGHSSGRSSLSTVVSPDSPLVPFPFKNAFPRMSYELRHRMHVYEQLFGSVERVTDLIMQTNWEEGSAPPEYWMDTSDHLYVIANTFNLCVVFLARSESTTVLPLVSKMDGPS